MDSLNACAAAHSLTVTASGHHHDRRVSECGSAYWWMVVEGRADPARDRALARADDAYRNGGPIFAPVGRANLDKFKGDRRSRWAEAMQSRERDTHVSFETHFLLRDVRQAKAKVRHSAGPRRRLRGQVGVS